MENVIEEETLEILTDPEMMAAMKQGLADIEAGRVHNHEDVWAELNAEFN
jgi:predicted transcriptional regulator